MTRVAPRWPTGAALVALYALVAVATEALSDGGGQPLFDGFAPPAPYRWVEPPPELAAGNRPPEPVERLVPLGEAGSEPVNARSPDTQIVITLQPGAVPPRPPDTAVLLRIVPLAVSRLGLLPEGMRVVANAYQLTMTYEPSQEAVAEVASTSSIAMSAALQSDTLLYSGDGREWTVQPSRPFGATHGRLGTLLRPGYYVVAASPSVHAPTTTTAPPGGNGGGGALVAVLVAVLVGAVAFAVVALPDRRRDDEAPARRSRRRRAG